MQQGLPGPPPQLWDDPKAGYPDEGGGEGRAPGLPSALRARSLPATRGHRGSREAPAKPGDLPIAAGRALRSQPRSIPRPSPTLGSQRRKVWRHGAATGGSAGTRGSEGAWAGQGRGARPEQGPGGGRGVTVEGVPTCSGGGRRRARPRGAVRGGGRTRGCGSPRPSRRAGREREAGRETQPEPSKSQRWSRPPRRAGLQLLTASGREPCPCRRRRAALPGPGVSQRLGAARFGSARDPGEERDAERFGSA